jgi:RNA polymerase sigma-70 factor (ECF subfamily)
MDRPRDTDEQPEAQLPRPVVQVLVDQHREFLGFLEKRVGNRALAEDLLQEAFVRGLIKSETLRADESAVAWFYRLLRNAVIDHGRRRGATDRKLAAFARELEDAVEPNADTNTAVCQCVTRLTATLPADYREALQAVEVEGLPVKDYAERAGILPNHAGVRVFRAREALRKRVARACGTCAEHGCLDCSCQATT